MIKKDNVDKKESKYLKLTIDQKTSITKYLGTRLGVFGINWFEFKWEDISIEDKKEFASHKIDMKHCGIMAHMLKECELNIIVLNPKKDSETTCHNINIHLNYKHCNGGDNGHQIDFELRINGNGLYEVK